MKLCDEENLAREADAASHVHEGQIAADECEKVREDHNIRMHVLKETGILDDHMSINKPVASSCEDESESGSPVVRSTGDEAGLTMLVLRQLGIVDDAEEKTLHYNAQICMAQSKCDTTGASGKSSQPPPPPPVLARGPRVAVSIPGAHHQGPTSEWADQQPSRGTDSRGDAFSEMDLAGLDLEEGLAEASPVIVSDQEAEPIDGLEQTEKRKSNKTSVMSCLLVLLLVCVCGISLALHFKSNGSSSSSSSSQQPSGGLHSSVGIDSPAGWTWDLPFHVPNSTLVTIESDRRQATPQHRAYQWIKEDYRLNNYSEDRLLQRFAMAVFYYSTGGEKWAHQGGGTITLDLQFPPAMVAELPASVEDNRQEQVNVTSEAWLSHGHSECDWFSTVITPMSQIRWDACNDHQHIQQLSLEFNNLQGSLPEELSLLTSLQVINVIGHNWLSGSIPRHIGKLTKLEKLLLGGQNHLTGTMPSEVGLLSNSLKVLALRANDLTGTLPSEFWRLSQLEILRVMYNRFSGTLPFDVGASMPRTKFFVIQGNSFSGTLPTSLGLVTSLVNFHAGRNSLSGSVPSELGLLRNLTDLWLEENNGITGQLPETLEALNSTLLSLKIQGTSITGTIPDGLCGIKELVFDCSRTLCGCKQCACDM